MARYHHNVYANSKGPNYLVIFDLQWQIIECRRLESSTDLRKEMTTTIDRLTQEGWQPECAPTKTAGAVLNRRRRPRRERAIDGTSNYGFVFLNRDGTRRLLILTERDPYDTTPQTFSPWSSIGPCRSGSMPSPGDLLSQVLHKKNTKLSRFL